MFKNKLLIIKLLVFATCSVSFSAFATNVIMETPLGDIEIELFDEVAPGTVENFLNYVNDGDYKDSFMHRSIPGFVIQGGGFTFDVNPPAADELDGFGSRQHRWFTASGHVSGDTAVLDIFLNSGGVFNDPRETMYESVGSMTIQFSDCTNAQLSFDFDGSDDRDDSVEIIRLSPDVFCQAIVDAAARFRRLLLVGREARLSWWIARLAPALYERLMIRRTLV